MHRSLNPREAVGIIHSVCERHKETQLHLLGEGFVQRPGPQEHLCVFIEGSKANWGFPTELKQNAISKAHLSEVFAQASQGRVGATAFPSQPKRDLKGLILCQADPRAQLGCQAVPTVPSAGRDTPAWPGIRGPAEFGAALRPSSLAKLKTSHRKSQTSSPCSNQAHILTLLALVVVCVGNSSVD